MNEKEQKILDDISADIHQIESDLVILRQSMDMLRFTIDRNETDKFLLDVFLNAKHLRLNPEISEKIRDTLFDSIFTILDNRFPDDEEYTDEEYNDEEHGV